MATANVPQRADEVFRTGPETLISTTPTIVVGHVSTYSKQIESMSEPAEHGFPLKWLVSGQIDRLQMLKGETHLTSLLYTKSEQSTILPTAPGTTYWEGEFGELALGSGAVVFLGDKNEAMKILPSGDGEQDLENLVRQVVRVQSIQDTQRQREAWMSLVKDGRTDHLRKAALRSLVHLSVPWTDIAPSLEQLNHRTDLSPNMHAFTSGLVAFAIMHDWLPEERLSAIDFLCRTFTQEHNPRLALQYVLYLKNILSWTLVEDRTRTAVRERILECIDHRPAGDAQIEEQYRQIRSMYTRK